MNIGERIKAQRKLRLLSQKQLAELSGLSEISIRKYEAGDRKPKLEQIVKIAQAMKMNESEFVEVSVSDTLDTVGDFFTILYTLREKVGFELSFDVNDEEKIDVASVSVRFKNDDVNKHLKNLAHIQRILAEREDAVRAADFNVEFIQIANESTFDSELRKLTEDATFLK